MEKCFWDILESDLSIRIPNFMKNSLKYVLCVINSRNIFIYTHLSDLVDFSLCGFDNPLSFKELSNEDISDIEKIMREKHAPIIEKKFAERGGSINMVDHFGKLYAENPCQFEFLPGEKKTHHW